MQPDAAPAKAQDGVILRIEGAIPVWWRTPLVSLAAAWFAVFALTFADWIAMFSQWWNISTYNHILFVPLIVGWLVWTRWDALQGLVPKAWWPGLLLLGGALFLWLLGSVAGVNSASQLGAVVALQACIVTVLGPRVALALAFPIAYLLFLVPFGDELVPMLQMITAKLVIAMTEWSGIPAIIDGVFIDTPVGLFEVAEACSGVKFLIAMIALGTLVSYTCFRGWKRRAAFMGAAVLLPVLANGVRAWGTIYIAQFQGIEFAEGFDHVFYGWVFFALVVGILFAVSWRWFNRDPEDIGLDFQIGSNGRLSRIFDAGSARLKAVFPGMFMLILLAGGWNALTARVEAELPAQIALPQVSGWSLQPYEPIVQWEPRATGADHRLLGRYRNSTGQEVDVFIALYSAQDEGREASAFGEGAFNPDSDWRWLAPGPAQEDAQSDLLLVYGQHKRLVQTSYRHGALFTGSAPHLKLATMRDRMLLQGVPTTMLILSSEMQDDGAAEQAIAEFRRSVGEAGDWLDDIVGVR